MTLPRSISPVPHSGLVPPIFADMGLGLGETIVKALAVLGGAALGALAIGALVHLLIKIVARRPPPKIVLRLVRLLGGVAAGLAVYLFVFGTGGGGLGGMGWGLGGAGTGTTGKNNGTPHGANATGLQRPSTNLSTPAERPTVLHVEMLGGKRYKNDDRYYLIVGEKDAHNLSELRAIIENGREQQPPLLGIEIVIREDDSVAENHPAVGRLRQLAEDLRLAVKVNTPAGEKR